MLVVMLSKVVFPGFAFCLYYNSIIEHVNKADEFRSHFLNNRYIR